MRSVLISPLQARTFPDTFNCRQSARLSDTGSLGKVTTLSSKVKSPWNPTSLFFASMAEVLTAAMKLLVDCTRESTCSRKLFGVRS